MLADIHHHLVFVVPFLLIRSAREEVQLTVFAVGISRSIPTIKMEETGETKRNYNVELQRGQNC